MSDYKWRLVIFPNNPKCPYFLAPLPASKEVSSNYIHKPGDIDYSCLSKLPDKDKASIREYALSGYVASEPMEYTARIAGIIFIDRLSVPNFMPAELDVGSNTGE